ncbi:hypothetical protein [Fluviicola sp.]|uniref:hypothetical protein n=1 Tax=Fluviicola sp. TaxID=1917219 RepID=UPI0031E033D1
MESDKRSASVNRIEIELMRWREKEERFKNAFSVDMSSNKALLKEQLRDYDRIVSMCKGSRDRDERSMLRIVRQERRSIQKQVYPGRLVRLFVKVFINPVRRFIIARENRRLEKANRLTISSLLKKMGLGEHFPKVEKKMKNGEPEFKVPISYQVNENEVMNHQLSFERANSGEYHLVQNKVRMDNETDPELSRQQIFILNDGKILTSDETYELLAGRALCKDGKWIRLDFCDKDTAGNFRVREFPESYGFDIERSLRELPLKDKSQIGKIADDLKKGKRTEVTIGRNKFFVEANPQFKSVTIYDSNSEKVSVSRIKGKTTVEENISEGQSNKRTTKNRRLGVA